MKPTNYILALRLAVFFRLLKREDAKAMAWDHLRGRM